MEYVEIHLTEKCGELGAGLRFVVILRETETKLLVADSTNVKHWIKKKNVILKGAPHDENRIS